jgi:hypothetical protein
MLSGADLKDANLSATLTSMYGQAMGLPPGGHPGTGHGAGRRTGSTPVASNAGP